jgi:2-C-methyl-D-erythritol 4-phosphate cytidylyltransferase
VSDGKLVALRCGGETRAASVRRALQAMRPWVSDDDAVLVHDAARPCLTLGLIDVLIEQAGAEPGGGLLAVPVADTLKRADSTGHVLETEPRGGLWQAQTPQLFRYGLLRAALEAAGADVTDEASAVERLGFRPKLVAGQTRNLKVTYPEELELAAIILRGLKP